jgi:hypothetical protein
VIADIQLTGEYLATLHAHTAEVTAPDDLGWRTWWSGPWMKTTILRACKHPPNPPGAG